MASNGFGLRIVDHPSKVSTSPRFAASSSPMRATTAPQLNHVHKAPIQRAVAGMVVAASNSRGGGERGMISHGGIDAIASTHRVPVSFDEHRPPVWLSRGGEQLSPTSRVAGMPRGLPPSAPGVKATLRHGDVQSVRGTYGPLAPTGTALHAISATPPDVAGYASKPLPQHGSSSATLWWHGDTQGVRGTRGPPAPAGTALHTIHGTPPGMAGYASKPLPQHGSPSVTLSWHGGEGKNANETDDSSRLMTMQPQSSAGLPPGCGSTLTPATALA